VVKVKQIGKGNLLTFKVKRLTFCTWKRGIHAWSSPSDYKLKGTLHQKKKNTDLSSLTHVVLNFIW